MCPLLPTPARFGSSPGLTARIRLGPGRYCLALLFDVVTECQVRNRGKDLPENLLAPDQGQAAKIMPVQVEEVKGGGNGDIAYYPGNPCELEIALRPSPGGERRTHNLHRRERLRRGGCHG